MVQWINEDSWLNEADQPFAGGPPQSQPGTPGDPMGQNMPAPEQGGPMPQPPAQEPEDLSQDPAYPDMPEEDEGFKDFENFRMKFVGESVKGDPNILEQMILKIRDLDLEVNQRKFVEDNLQICFLRQHQDYLHEPS